jgi:hypothetical protein
MAPASIPVNTRRRHRREGRWPPHRRLHAHKAEAKKFGRQRVKVVDPRGDDEASPPDPQQKADAKAENRRAKAKNAPPK